MKLERFALLFGLIVVASLFIFFADSSGKGHLYPSSHPAKSIITGPQASKSLVFSDEFNGTTVNAKKWGTCYDWKKPTETGCTNEGNFEQQWYTDQQTNVGGGQLTLKAVRSPIDVAIDGKAKSFEYQSGMLNSGAGASNRLPRWTGTYGYYESRMYVPKGQGVWPAFWLLPGDRKWPPEIDAMEFIGNKPGQILQTVHWMGDNGPALDDSAITKLTDYSVGWHTYGVDWSVDKIDWYIDGIKTKTFTGPNVPSKPMEIILNLAVGGLLPGKVDATTPQSLDMKVDYVRVYQSNDQIRPVSK